MNRLAAFTVCTIACICMFPLAFFIYDGYTLAWPLATVSLLAMMLASVHLGQRERIWLGATVLLLGLTLGRPAQMLVGGMGLFLVVQALTICLLPRRA